MFHDALVPFAERRIMIMKRVLLITNIPSPYSVDLFYYLQKEITDYEFYVLYTSKTEDNRQWKVDETKIINTTYVKSWVLRIKTKLDYRYIHITKGINNKLNEILPDVIISWEYNPTSVQAMKWCKLKKKKFISGTDGTLRTEQNLWFIQKLTRKYIAKNADAFLVSGIKAEEKILSWGVDKKKVFKKLLTVDLSIFKKATRSVNNNTILYVGSLVERKGVDLLICALSNIKNDYILRIVGNGRENELQKLKKLAEQKGVADKIVWCGFKTGDELVKEYQEAAVFVMPTREDCFGLVLLEAMAVGVPIIASKFADGAYDVVKNGITGWIVDPYNDVEFAEAIDKIINDVDFQNNCYTHSRKEIEKFEYSEVSKGFVDAINFVLAK